MKVQGQGAWDGLWDKGKGKGRGLKGGGRKEGVGGRGRIGVSVGGRNYEYFYHFLSQENLLCTAVNRHKAVIDRVIKLLSYISFEAVGTPSNYSLCNNWPLSDKNVVFLCALLRSNFSLSLKWRRGGQGARRGFRKAGEFSI